MTYRKPRSPRKDLLKITEIQRWYDNMGRGSVITADTYFRRLGAFCEATHTTPLGLPQKTEKELHALLLDFVSAEERKKRTGSYIMSTVKAVKSWLLHNGVRINLPVKVRGADRAPTLEGERTPSQDELRRLFLTAGPRDRVSAALMAHSGVRPEVLGNYKGTDGLRIRDFPELRVKDGKVEFERMPTMVVVRAELSKAGHRYITFLGDEGCSYIRDYLERRLAEGETIGPETDLIHSKGSGKASSKWTGGPNVKSFIYTTKVGDQIRKVIRASGFEWRPYILRAYFDTQLLMAESKGKVAHDFRVFWMGHKGSMEARYTTNKGRLPKDLLDEMRSAYGRCQPFLETTAVGRQEDVPKEVARAMLQLAGFGEEEIEKLDLNDLAAIRDQVRDRLGASDAPRQEVVPIGEIPQRLAAGWQFVAALGTTQAILTSRSSPRTSPTPGASALPPRAATSPVPPAGQAAEGGSKGGGPPTTSGAGGPSLPPQFPPRVSGRPAAEHSVAAHRLEPQRDSPEENSPGQG